MPAWNAQATLAGTLEALIEGNGQEIERIIVVASPGDGSADLADAYPGVTVLRPPVRLSAGAARNLGRRRAAGSPMLLFVDADCRLEAGAVRLLLDELRVRPGLGVVAASILRDGGGAVAWVRHALEFKEWGRAGPSRARLFVPSAVLACRAADFDRVGGFADMWPGEDLVFCRAVAGLGLGLACLRNARAYHRHPPGLGTMFVHQYRLGHSSALARLRTGMPGVGVARRPWLAPLLLPGRTVRAFLWFTTRALGQLPVFLLTLPLYVAGLTAWTAGFTACAFGRAEYLPMADRARTSGG